MNTQICIYNYIIYIYYIYIIYIYIIYIIYIYIYYMYRHIDIYIFLLSLREYVYDICSLCIGAISINCAYTNKKETDLEIACSICF